MDEFMKVLLSLSISGTLLLLLVLLSKQLYKTKLSRIWQYYIWLVAALRFLLPFTPDTTIVGGLFAVGNSVTSFENMEITHSLAMVPVDIIITESENVAVSPVFSIGISDCLFLLWLVPALFILFRKIAVYRKFIRRIGLYNVEVLDAEYIKLLADCREKMNIRKKVTLCRNAGIASPIMTGLIRPCIILPMGQVKKEELYYIFTHELIHYKRRDMLYKWLIQLVLCIHWFNPFVYLLGKEINRACELACDEAVISSLDDNGKRAYGDTLLSCLRKNNSRRDNFVSVTLTEGAEQVKERLGAIMDFHRKSKGIKAVTLVLTIVFCVCFVVAGAYAAEGTTPDRDEADGTVAGGTALNGTMAGGTVLNGTMAGGTVLNGTVAGGTVLNGTMLDGTVQGETASDKAAIDKSILNNTAAGETILDRAALENGAPEGAMLDKTAMDDLALCDVSPDSTCTLLHWYGTSSDVSRDIPEGASGYIIIKNINEDGSVGYIGWGIEHKDDEQHLKSVQAIESMEMLGSVPVQAVELMEMLESMSVQAIEPMKMPGGMPAQAMDSMIYEDPSTDGKVKVLIGRSMTVNEEGKRVECNTYVYIPEDAEVVSYMPAIVDGSLGG